MGLSGAEGCSGIVMISLGYGHMQEAVQRMTIQSMGQLPVPLSANALTHLQIVQAAADNAERCVQEAEQ